MSITALMAAILKQELQKRGIASLSAEDCQAIAARMIARAAEAEALCTRSPLKS